MTRSRSPRQALAAVFSRAMRSGFARQRIAPHLASVQLRLYRLTGGRVQLSGILVPSLLLVHTGAKSGTERETPLMCFPEPDGTYLVSGSNWGRPQHPAWTANLLAHPASWIVVGRRRLSVSAELVHGAEREALWPLLEKQWPGYREYETTAGREMRIFRLRPREAGHGT